VPDQTPSTQPDRSDQSEERTRGTRTFVRRVHRAARRKYPPEEKIRIVLEGFRREVTVNDLCRREGINPASYYTWTK
jgi:transposase-like protein